MILACFVREIHCQIFIYKLNMGFRGVGHLVENAFGGKFST